jgi:hypothetical protein
VVTGLIEEFPDTFAMVEIHAGDGSYNTAWGNQRKTFYSNVHYPDMWMDGVSHPDATTSQYRPALRARQQIPTDVTIEMTALESGTQTYDVRARVCVEASGTQHTMRIYMVQLLNNWPTSTATHKYHNTVRQGATTEDVTVAPGECADVTRTFVMDAISWNQQADIEVAAWAQVPNNHSPAEVYQAKIMKWPFPLTEDVFADGFDTGDASGWSLVIP